MSLTRPGAADGPALCAPARHPHVTGSELAFCAFVLGATALLGQAVLTRELLAFFSGNELTIAFVLAAWLLAVAAGSWLGARLAEAAPAVRLLGWSQAGMGMVLPASVVAGRALPAVGRPVGEMASPLAMALIALVTLIPVGGLVGWQFALAVRAATPEMGSRAAARVYVMEALGATVAGVAFHFRLAEATGPLALAAGAALLAVAAAALLLCRPEGWSPWRAVPLVGIGALLIVLLLRSSALELASLRASPRWAGLHPIAFSPSKYGTLLATREHDQVAIYQSGVLMVTSQDQYVGEVTAHLPLLAHPRPRRVLLIGGACSAAVAEALKHPLDRLECVELDPAAFRFASRFLLGARRALSDPRVHILFGDGRAIVRSSRRRWDVIIVNLPDPTTAALNRFYTREFFAEARRALNPGGILCFGFTGSEAYLAGPVLEGAAILVRTASAVFPGHRLVPGVRTLVLCSDQAGPGEAGWEVLAQRLAQRRLDTHFVNDAWLRDALQPLRVALAEQAIAQAPPGPPNTDLHPVSYYHYVRLWLQQVAGGRARRPMAVGWLAAGAAILGLLGMWLVYRSPGAPVLLAVAATGAMGLTLEAVAMLVFQAARGYLYHAFALMVAMFMAGLAGGAAFGEALLRRRIGRALDGHFALTLAVALVLGLAAPGVLWAALTLPAAALGLLGALLVMAAVVVGFLFPLAAQLYGDGAGASAAGAVYAADLAGSAGAALAVGTLGVPLLGATQTCLIASALPAVALVLILIGRRR